MKQQNKILFIAILAMAFIGFSFFFKGNNVQNDAVNEPLNFQQSQSIDQLTNAKTVINYIKKHKKLPDYYITKNEARKHGWIASKGNLCEVLPNKAIGGDKFGNRERKLPDNQQYYEADVNYKCGRRNSDRVIFTKKGEVWLTQNHYKSFEKQ